MADCRRRGGGRARRAVARILAVAAAVAVALVSRPAWCHPGSAASGPSAPEAQSAGRRKQIFAALAGAGAAAGAPWRPHGGSSAARAADTTAQLLEELRSDKAALEPLPEVLKEEKWDQVRSVLKTPPVGKLWNLGESKNPLKKLGENLGDPTLLEISEDLSGALQLADQFTYDNNFIPFQPGPGKVKIKEPTDQVLKAIKKLDEALKVAAEGR